MRKYAKVLFFSAAVIALLAVLLVFQMLRSENEIAIFVTGDTEGYIVPCGCRTSPAGGLSRRVTLMERFKAENPSRRVVPVELPSLFMDRGPARDVVNRALGDFLLSRGYIVSPGANDLLFGDKLRDYYKGEYYLAGEKGFKDEEVFELGGFRHIPLGKKGRLHLLFISETGLSERKLKDPLSVYREKTSKAPGDAYMVLGNLSPVTIQGMIKEKANLVAAVATWGHTATSMPQKADNTWVVFLGDKGRKYTLFEIGYFEGRWEIWPKTEYIDKDLDADPESERAVREALGKADEINHAAIEKSRAVKADPPYAGSVSCEKCHPEEAESWKKTRHAEATRTLEIDHQENNPECLACHSTGFGNGGYPDGKEIFGGVGCESCHGAGGGHPPKPMPEAGQAARKCGLCHTKRDSPNFNEDLYYRMVDHRSVKSGK